MKIAANAKYATEGLCVMGAHARSSADALVEPAETGEPEDHPSPASCLDSYPHRKTTLDYGDLEANEEVTIDTDKVKRKRTFCFYCKYIILIIIFIL